MDLGWVDFDLGVPPSCPPAQPLLPNFHGPKQNWADSETQNSSQTNHAHDLMGHPVGYSDSHGYIYFSADEERHLDAAVQERPDADPAGDERGGARH